MKYILKYVIARCGSTVLQAEATRHEFLRQGILTPQKATVIPPGVDYSFLAGDELRETITARDTPTDGERHLILYVGRINAEKGLHFLLDAMDIVVNRMGRKETMVALVGPYEEFDNSFDGSAYVRSLMRFVERRNLKENVEFIGYRGAEEIRRLYARCALTVLPSLTEAFGMVISESMVCGKPVVASATHGAHMQIRDGINGLLVDPGDAAALADRLVYLLDRPDERARLGDAGRRFAEQFDWPIIATRYLELFRELRQCLLPHQ